MLYVFCDPYHCADFACMTVHCVVLLQGSALGSSLYDHLSCHSLIANCVLLHHYLVQRPYRFTVCVCEYIMTLHRNCSLPATCSLPMLPIKINSLLLACLSCKQPHHSPLCCRSKETCTRVMDMMSTVKWTTHGSILGVKTMLLTAQSAHSTAVRPALMLWCAQSKTM